MRRKALAFILVTVLLAACFTGCGKNEKKKGPFEVYFDLAGGDRVSGKLRQTVEYGEAAEEPVAEREGYIFNGWDTEFNEVTSDLEVTAEWKKAVKATFELEGGTVEAGSDVQVLAVGKKPVAPTVVREGYRFDGWDTEIKNIYENTTYKAMWTRLVPSADEVYNLLASSMVEIHTYDEFGQGIALGSGFFIDTEGTVLTNYHVMEGAYSAEIIMYDEEDYMISRVLGYSKDIDLCIVKTIAEDTKPVTFFTGDVRTGETVYTLGSSIGLTGTFSNGIVSTASRQVEGVECIQITAPISHGNSGGPLVNEFGEVLGVNTFMFTEGQNLNFAVSIKELENIDRSESITIHKFGELTGENVTPNYTVVKTGDEGEGVYKIANDIELEPNDTLARANTLWDGYWTAAYLSKGETDVFSLEVTARGWIDVYLVAYWHDDDEYLYATLRDADGNEVSSRKTGRSATITDSDYEDNTYMHASFKITEAGTYYLDVHLPNNYPFKNGCYYLIGYEAS